MPRLLYRIIATSRKRMAAEDAANTEISPPNGTIFFNCLNCVRGTGGKKAATRRQKGRKNIFIPFYHPNKHCFEEVASHRFMLPENNRCGAPAEKRP